MRRITITMSDEEYAALEQRAAQDRRTPREMAAYLVTRQPSWTDYLRPVPYPSVPWQPWTVGSGSTYTAPLCPACSNPGTTAGHTCTRLQNVTTCTLN